MSLKKESGPWLLFTPYDTQTISNHSNFSTRAEYQNRKIQTKKFSSVIKYKGMPTRSLVLPRSLAVLILLFSVHSGLSTGSIPLSRQETPFYHVAIGGDKIIQHDVADPSVAAEPNHRLGSRTLATSTGPSGPAAVSDGTGQTCGSVRNTTGRIGEIGKIQVQLFMMSTCKYGQAAMKALLPSVSNCKGASIKADFIGHGNAQRGFSSTLGRNDVIGDVYMLCAQQVFSSRDITPMAIPYFQCLIEDSTEEISVLGETCKKRVENTDFQDAVYRCVRSRQVSFALEDSFKRSKDAGAVISPTIMINGEHYCGPIDEVSLEDAIAKAMQGISMTTLGECGENGVSQNSKGCKDSGSHYTYSILLFMILFSSTATLLLIACFAAFRRNPAGARMNRFQGGSRMPWLQGQGGVAMQQRRRGTPAEVFDQFDKVIFQKLETDDQDEDQCSICISEYENGEAVLTLPCNHKFHASCIKQWLEQSVKCPLCNREVTSEPSSVGSQHVTSTVPANDGTATAPVANA